MSFHDRNIFIDKRSPTKILERQETKQAVSEGVSGLVSSYNQAYGQARQANEQRYQQLLQIADQDYQRSAGIRDQMLKETGDVGGQRAADIRSEGEQEQTNVMQRLRSLGMSSTLPTWQAGIKKRTDESLNRLAFSLQGERRDVMREQAGATRSARLGIMERREDTYPDRSELTGLISSIGTGQGGDLIPSTFGALKKLRA